MLPYFQLKLYLVAPASGVETKSNASAQHNYKPSPDYTLGVIGVGRVQSERGQSDRLDIAARHRPTALRYGPRTAKGTV